MISEGIHSRVYFLHSSSLIGGGNKVILRLIDQLNKNRFYPLSVIPSPGPMIKELSQRGVKTCSIDFRETGTGSIADLLSFLRFTLVLASMNTTIVHANDPFTYGKASRAWSPQHVRWICHVHHPDIDPDTLRWSFRRPPRSVITPSEFMAEKVRVCLETTMLHVPVVRIYNPIDVDWFSPAVDRRRLMGDLGCDPNGRHVIIVGAIAPHKGHDVFIKMAKLLGKSLQRIYFHIVGSTQSGSDSHAVRMKRLIQDLGVDHNIKYWGFVSDEVVRDVMKIADVFVLPTQAEGFGLVLAESQACGVPVVTSNIRPLNEVVVHKETGFLIDDQDPAGYAAKVDSLLTNEKLRLEMGQAGRQLVKRRFSSTVFCDAVCAEYERVLREG